MTKFNTTNNNNNQKEQHFFSLALRSLLCMWFVDCSLLVWRSFLKKGTPLDLFLPHPGSTHGRIWPKRQTHAREFAMSSLSLPSRGEMIYRWDCSTEASIRVMVGGGLESIRICLSEIFWLNLHCIRFLSDLFLLARMVWKPVDLQAQPFRVFCAFSPTAQETYRNKLRRCMCKW